MNKLSTTLLIVALNITRPSQAVEKASEKRLDEVAQRGSHVMPFDLEQTTHVFSKTGDGGIQQVIVKDPSNTRQIDLIRTHLLEISRQFSQGDFSNPEMIHGKNMPGLAELRKAETGQIKIEYTELPEGAQIEYSTDSPSLIQAIHQWFDAQLSDHSRHSMPGHSSHQMNDK